MRGRRRNTATARRLPQRATTLDLADELTPASRSELGVTVKEHPGPPLET
jgi:hypothetical protein